MRIESRSRGGFIGLLIAIAAGVHKAILASTPGNDDFQHLAYARQLLAGDLPLRDFWDLSTTLQVALSAGSQMLFGHRLIAEAVVVGFCTAVAVFLVFRVVHTMTGSGVIAAVCASLFIVAVPRVYAYPKWVVYAAVASVWWNYTWWPSAQKAIAAGATVAVAFYWRHDHGAIAAAGVALAMLAAHGFSVLAARRTALAGAVALAFVSPYLVFAELQVGLVNLARTELAALRSEHHEAHDAGRWPLRTAADLVQTTPADAYAPEITVRWRADATRQDRAAAVEQYRLAVIGADGPRSDRVRLSAESLARLRALIDDPRVEDTGGVERGPAAFTWEQWPIPERLAFHYRVLRLRLLPGLDQPAEAGAAAAMHAVALPVLGALLAAPVLRRRLPPAVSPRALLLFAVFATVVNLGLLREPYASRVAEVIVLPSIVFGVFLAVVLRHGPWFERWPLRLVALLLTLLVGKSLASAGDFSTPVGRLAGVGTSPDRARTAWRDVYERLMTSPPSAVWTGAAPPNVTIAQYVRRCVGPDERILVLWYAPEIYFDSDRRMAGRHVYYPGGLRDVEIEQRLESEKVLRSAPPIVISNPVDDDAANAFPDLMRDLERTYRPAAAFEEEGRPYEILVRRDRPATAQDPATGWPCFRQDTSRTTRAAR